MKLNQKGSAVIVGLLAAILILAIGGVGYMVYSNQKNKNIDTNNSTSTSNDSTTSSDQLEIKEWAVKINIPKELGTVTYRYENTGYERILFVSTVYENKDGWGISRFAKTPENEAKKFANQPADRKKTVGDFYFRLDGPASIVDDKQAAYYSQAFQSME